MVLLPAHSPARIAPLVVLCWAFLSLLCVSRLAAQVNIEKLRPATTGSSLSGNIEIEWALRSGSVNRHDLKLASQLGLAAEDGSGWLLLANGGAGWQEGARYSNRGLLHVRRIQSVGRERVLLEAFAQVNYARERLLDFRGLLGMGVRLRLHSSAAQSEEREVWCGTGHMLEREHLDLSPHHQHPQSTTAHRWSSYLSVQYTWATGRGISSTTYLQPRLDALGDVRLLNDSRLEVTVAGPLSLTVSLHLLHDSDPPDGVESLELEIGSGLRLLF
jgi:hypothetical protein